MSPKISIIVPCFNQTRYLAECLQSCLGQSFRGFEVIVVDDGTTDGSSPEAERLCSRDPRIRYFRLGENKGASYARNYGLSKSSASLLYFLDADDYLCGGEVLETLSAGLLDGVDFVYGDKIVLEQATQIKTAASQSAAPFGDPVLDIINYCPITSTVLFRRKFFDRVKWNEADHFSQEYNLIVSGVIEGAVYRHIPAPAAVIRRHDSPSRITVRYSGSDRLKRTLVLLSSEEKLKMKGSWSKEREAYFHYEYCAMSLFMFYHASDPGDRQLSQWLWDKIDKRSLAKSRSFSLLSWCGLSFLTNARIAARLWRLRDHLAGRLR